MISKSNFKFHCGRADILEIVFLAMNQIHVNHIQWITREFLSNKIRSTSLCTRTSLGVDKEVLTKIASCFLTSETSRCWNYNWLRRSLSTPRRCQNFFEVLRPAKWWSDDFGGKSSLSFGDKSKRWKCFLINPLIGSKLGLYMGTRGKIFGFKYFISWRLYSLL